MSGPWRRAERASCLATRRRLQSYLDEELDEVSAARIARHLEACRRGCCREASLYSEIKAAVKRSQQQTAAYTAQLTTRSQLYASMLTATNADNGGRDEDL